MRIRLPTGTPLYPLRHIFAYVTYRASGEGERPREPERARHKIGAHLRFSPLCFRIGNNQNNW